MRQTSFCAVLARDRAERYPAMIISTFNCNSIRARLPQVLHWLSTHRADILALQETKTTDENFPAEAFQKQGYGAVYRGEKGYNGVAFVFRKAPDAVSFGFPRAPADKARLAYARWGSLHVVTTYVPQGRSIDHPMYAYKVRWLSRLRRWFDARFSKNDLVVWLGDMNVAAEPVDVHNPEVREEHVCFHRAARKAFAMCRAWGFIDLYRQFHPEPGRYTFFDYRTPFNPSQNRGWRLDYIFASPPLAARVRACEIDLSPRSHPRPSDHVPVYAELDLLI